MDKPVVRRLRDVAHAACPSARRRGDGTDASSTGVAFESAGSRNRLGNEGYDAVRTVGGTRSEPMTIDQVVDHIVEVEDSLAGWGAVHERLYFVDLPALDAEGTIEFDPESGLVSLRD